MTIIDAHIHLWSHDHTRYPDKGWRANGQSTLPPNDGTAERVVAMMDESGVAWALNVQVPWYEEDNRYHHDAVTRFPGRFSFLAVVDLDTPGAGDRLTAMVETERAQGVRIHLVEPGRTEKVCAGAHDDVLAAAARAGIPVQFLARDASQLDAAWHVARHFDGLKVVIDHLCHPDPSHAPDYTPWAPFFGLASYPAAYVKVSLQVNCSKAAFPFADLHGFQRRTLEAYGVDRCMWGSNYPLFPDRYRYDDILAVVRDHLPGLSTADKARLLGGTAASLWQPI